MTIENTIPHSVDAEQSVIGAVLISGSAIDGIGFLKPDHFYVNAHKELFKVIVAMSMAGKTIDAITLAEEVSDAGLDHATGGLPYIGEIASNTPSAANVKTYAEIVRSKAIERQLLSAVDEIRSVVMSNGQTKEKLNKAQSLIMAIAESRQAKAPRSLAEGLDDYVAEIERRFNGETSGIQTGFKSLDDSLNGGLKEGQLIIVAGRPAMGKSAFTNSVALHIAGGNKTVGLFSMEMTELDQYDRVVATIGRVGLDDVLQARLNGDAGDRIQYAIGKMKEIPLIIDDSAGVSVHELMSKARQIKRKRGLDLLIVDALGLMEYDNNNSVSELGIITKALKTFAKEMSIPVVLLHQLSRKCEERIDKRPVLSDLRDSGTIEQDADVVIMLYRDVYYNADTPDKNIAEVLIRKNRQGRTGVVPLVFIGEQTRFESLAGEWHQREAPQAGRSRSSKSRMGNND